MPKVIEVLVKVEKSGQVWYDRKPLPPKETKVLQPSHLEKGVRASPSKIDSYKPRE